MDRTVGHDMQLEIHGGTVKGPVRARNEDHVLVLDAVLNDGARAVPAAESAHFAERHGGAVWAAVADGVGGAPSGHEASRATLESLRDRLAEHVPNLPFGLEQSFLDETLRLVNAQVLTHGEIDPDRRGMCSTLCGVLLRHSQAYIFHAGDSRIYRLSAGVLDLLTRDHATPGMIAQVAGMTLEEAVETGSASLNGIS